MIMLDGFCDLPLLLQGNAQVGVRHEAVRPELEHVSILDSRLIRATGLLEILSKKMTTKHSLIDRCPLHLRVPNRLPGDGRGSRESLKAIPLAVGDVLQQLVDRHGTFVDRGQTTLPVNKEARRQGQLPLPLDKEIVQVLEVRCQLRGRQANGKRKLAVGGPSRRFCPCRWVCIESIYRKSKDFDPLGSHLIIAMGKFAQFGQTGSAPNGPQVHKEQMSRPGGQVALSAIESHVAKIRHRWQLHHANPCDLRDGRNLLSGADKSCLASRQCDVPRRARALNQTVTMVDIEAGKLLDISARPMDGYLIDDVGRAQPEVEPLARLRQKTFTSA